MPQRSLKEILRRQNKKLPKSLRVRSKWNPTHLALLIFLTILGSYIRLEPTLFDTVHFSYDQGVDISYVRKLVLEHKLSLIGRFTGLEGVFLGPFWTWILAVPYILSGGNPTANVIFFSIFGVLAIWLTYILVRRMLSESAAILSSTYVAFSGAFLAASHIVLSPHILTILMIPYLWFLWEIIEHGNEKFWPWLGLFAGLFFQFEIGFAIFLVPATFLILAVLGRLKRSYILKKPALLGFIFFLATFLPQVLFELRHDFLMTKAITRFFSGENTSLGREPTHLLGRLFIRIGSLWEDYSSSIVLGERNSLFAVLIAIATIFGWRAIKESKDKTTLRVGYMLLIIIAIMYAGFTLFPGPVWVWYRAGLPIVFVLLVTIGLAQLFDKYKLFRWITIIGFSSMIIFRVLPSLIIARGVEDYEGGPATIRNQKQALDLVFIDARDEPFALYVYTPPIYTYVWDHMLSWYAKPRYANYPVEYGYQPSGEMNNIFYLLIEPDELQDRIDGWKGNFVAYGKPIDRWVLSGGIIIEKWEVEVHEK